MQETEVFDEQRCPFGRWYFGAGQEHFGHLQAFRNMAEVHRRVHQLGSELLRLHREARHDDYRRRLAELETLRDELIARLRELRQSAFHHATQAAPRTHRS